MLKTPATQNKGFKSIQRFGLSMACVLALSACSTTQDANSKVERKSDSLFGNKIHMPFQKKRSHEEEVIIQANLADQHYQNGDFVQAEAAYQRLLELDPKQSAAYYRLGNIAFRNKEFKRASYYFNKTLELMPRNEKAQYNLAVTFLSLAEQHFKYYTAILPQDADVSRITKVLSSIDEFAADDQAGVARGTPPQQDDSALNDLAKQLQ